MRAGCQGASGKGVLLPPNALGWPCSTAQCVPYVPKRMLRYTPTLPSRMHERTYACLNPTPRAALTAGAPPRHLSPSLATCKRPLLAPPPLPHMPCWITNSDREKLLSMSAISFITVFFLTRCGTCHAGRKGGGPRAAQACVAFGLLACPATPMAARHRAGAACTCTCAARGCRCCGSPGPS